MAGGIVAGAGLDLGGLSLQQSSVFTNDDPNELIPWNVTFETFLVCGLPL